ncbi:hypothetical protein TKK_0010575 [Trichogramma kaykai]
MAKMLFEISDELGQTVQVDARDKLGNAPLHLAMKNSRAPYIHEDVRDKKGRTMLQRAVASYLPLAVRAILNDGADLASFVFP